MRTQLIEAYSKFVLVPRSAAAHDHAILDEEEEFDYKIVHESIVIRFFSFPSMHVPLFSGSNEGIIPC
jgi:hypothetical protein